MSGAVRYAKCIGIADTNVGTNVGRRYVVAGISEAVPFGMRSACSVPVYQQVGNSADLLDDDLGIREHGGVNTSAVEMLSEPSVGDHISRSAPHVHIHRQAPRHKRCVVRVVRTKVGTKVGTYECAVCGRARFA